jgi:hypothetical protein
LESIGALKVWITGGRHPRLWQKRTCVPTSQRANISTPLLTFSSLLSITTLKPFLLLLQADDFSACCVGYLLQAREV